MTGKSSHFVEAQAMASVGVDARSWKCREDALLMKESRFDDMADPNSYFDMDIGVPFPYDSLRAGHRQSKSSSDSKEFDFSMCMTPPDFEDASNISSADELFYKGKLLPLYLSKRMHLAKNLSSQDLAAAAGDKSSITFSCYLHRADVDIDMVLEPSANGYESYRDSSRDSRDKDSSGDSSSRDSSEGYEDDSYFRHDPRKEKLLSCNQQAFNNESAAFNNESAAFNNESARFRWKLFLGQKKSSKVAGFEQTKCDVKVCKFCGQRKLGETRSFNAIPSSPYKQPEKLPPAIDVRHSIRVTPPGDEAQESGPQRRSAYNQSVFRAKEFCRKYLKVLNPFNSKTSQHRSYFKPPEESSASSSDKSFFSGNLRVLPKRSSSRSTTPLSSPAHSGILSTPTDGVQGAIAYCKQTRSAN